MGNVVPFHAASSSALAKSSAVTRPSVALRSAMAKERDSQTLPRRNLDTVERSHSQPASRISEAIDSSSNSRRDMNVESFMGRNVHPAHNEVKSDRAWADLVVHTMTVHNTHMSTTARKYRQKPPADVGWTSNYLRQWREFRKISIAAAAAEIGISHSQLSRIERGKQEYRQSYLESLARLYGTSIWALLYCQPGASADQVFAAFQISTKPLTRH